MEAIARKFRWTVPLKIVLLFNLVLFSIISYAQSPPESGPCGRTFLNFDGSNDFLDVQGTTIEGNAGTFEAWVRKDNWTLRSNGVLFGNDIAFNTTNSIYLSFHAAAGLHFRYGDNSSEPTTGGAIFGTFTDGFAANSWHHIAVTWEHVAGTTTLKMYIDGVEQTGFIAGSRTTHNGLIDPGSSLNFGFSQGENYLEAGSMAEIRTWNVARTEMEISGNMNSSLSGTESGLTGYWPVDDSAGSTSASNLVSGAPTADLINFDVLSAWENKEATLQLSGTEGAISNGGTHDLSFTEVGQSVTQTLTLTNITSTTLNFIGSPIVTLSGTDASLFSLDQSGLTSSLVTGAQMSFDVTFAPVTTGNFSAALAFQSDETCGNATFSVNLEGAGQIIPTIVTHDRAIVSEGSSAVIDVDAIDNNGGTADLGIAYTLAGNDASLFQINGTGQLSFLNAPSFVQPQDQNTDQTYEMTITATSSLGSVDQNFSVTVFDAPGGALGFDVTPETVSGITATFTQGTISSGRLFLPYQGATDINFDQNINVSSIRFQTSNSGTFYTINPIGGTGNTESGGGSFSGELEVSLNYSDVSGISVVHSGGFGSPVVLELAFTVPSPTFSSANQVTFDENGAGVVLDVDAKSPNESTVDTNITYGINTEYDGTLFSISSTGEVAFQNAPSFENPLDIDSDNIYELLIEAASGAGSSTQLLVIEVTDVNDPPVLASIQNQSVNIGRTLTFAADISEEDAGQNLTVELDASSVAKGMTIDVSGNFSWTPALADIGSHSVTITVTDDGVGTLSDQQTFTIDVFDANEFPVLDAIGNQLIDEENALTFTATGSDSDVPAQSLTFSLDVTSIASGMSITAGGDFSWTPTEAQSGDHTVILTVTDDGPGLLTGTETITITVNEVNQAPILAAIGDQTFDELTNLSLTVSATDTDLPANALSYALDATSLSEGMTIDASTGDFSWTPTEEQDGTYTVTFTVSDDQSPALIDTETITITVNEVNLPPVIQLIGDQTVDEEALLDFDVRVNDFDSEEKGQTIIITVDQVSIDKGISVNKYLQVFSTSLADFTWTPTEIQDGVHTVTVTADDGVGGIATETFDITVADVNKPPVLSAIGDQSVDEENTLNFTANATDTDDPVNSVSFSLDATSTGKGMFIDGTTGAFTWTPTEAQSGDHNVTITATDDGAGTLSASEAITITVNEINTAPFFPTIGDQAISEGIPVNLSVAATDVDIPANSLTYQLNVGQSTIASINNSTGELTLSGTETQGGSQFLVEVQVTDDGTGLLSDVLQFNVTVTETNSSPVLNGIGDQSIDEETTLNLTIVATDIDMPAHSLTYSLDATSIGKGMTLDSSTGAFNWTPNEQHDGDHTVTFTVTDDGAGTLTDTETITITVNEINQNPTISGPDSWDLPENAFASRSYFIEDPDGQAVTIAFDASATALGFGVNSVNNPTVTHSIFWNVPLEVNVATFDVTMTVTDGVGGATDYVITMNLEEVNQAPLLAAIGDQSGDEETALNFMAAATDADLPANELSFSLDATSLGKGMSINATTGEFSWTPTETQQGAHTVTITATDDDTNSLTDAETLTVTINEVNTPPILSTVGNQMVNELEALTFMASASDNDVPTNTLTYALDASSIGKGMSVDRTTGAVIWTPSETQDGDHTVTLTVTDDGTGTLSDEETFTISVNEVNVAPVLAVTGDQSVNEETTLNLTIVATDADSPENTLTFSLDATSVSAGMSVDDITGDFSWTPTESQDGDHTVTIMVEDNGMGNLMDQETFKITVNESNNAPVISTIGDQTVAITEPLTISISVSDQDLPANTLTYSIDATSTAKGIAIDATTGNISWTPVANDLGANSVIVSVSDGTVSVNESFDIVVVEAIATVTLSNLTQTYNGQSKSVTATTDPTGLMVDFTYDGTTSEPTLVGSYVVVATINDDSYAGTASGTLNIEKADQSIAFDAIADKIYGDDAFELSASAGGSGNSITYASSDESVAIISGTTVTIVGAGTTNITASQEGDENHNAATDVTQNLTVDKAAIMVIADDQSRKFNEENPTLTISYGSFVGDDTEADLDELPTVSTVAESGSDVGTYSVEISGGADDDYSFTGVSGTLTVNQASQMITFSKLKDMVIGDEVFDLTATTSSGLSVTYVSSDETVATISGSNVTIVGVGETSITASQAGNDNYEAAADVSQNLLVKSTLGTEQAITFGELSSKTYGDVAFELSATASSDLEVNYTSSDESVATISGSTVVIVGVGTTSITATQDGNTTFGAAEDVVQTLTVAKATLKASADDQAKIFGANNPELTISYSGFVNDEDASVLDEAPTVSTSSTTTSGAGAYSISVSGGSAINYDFEYVSGTLIIQKADQFLTFDALDSRTIGDVDFELTAMSSSGLEITYTSSDESVATISGNTISIVGVGTTTITASQSGNDNYETASAIDQTLTVLEDMNLQSQTITFEALTDQVYGNDPFELNATSSSGLAVSYTSSDERLVVVSGNTVSILGAGNVMITALQAGDDTFAAATEISRQLVISKAELTIAANDQSIMPGDEIPVFSLSYTGLIGDDTSETLDELPRAATEATSESPVGTYEIILSGGQDNNYELILVNGVLTIEEALTVDLSESGNLVYPNPVSHQLFIDLREQSRELFNELKVFDLQGKLLKSVGVKSKTTILDVSDLPNGVLLIRLKGEEYVQSRLIKQ